MVGPPEGAVDVGVALAELLGVAEFCGWMKILTGEPEGTVPEFGSWFQTVFGVTNAPEFEGW